MGNFWKSVIATILGIVILSVVVSLVCCAGIIGSLASEGASPSIKSNSVLVLNLNGTLEERAADDPLATLMSSTGNQTNFGLDEILSAIKNAKENDDVKGIFIQAGSFSSDSWASEQAIRKALVDFKKSGKWIVSYADNYSQSTYYLASAGDKILLNPNGMVEWMGIASQPMYLKHFLAKFGVKFQLAKVGTYKSAPETFMADEMSDANREQITAYINSIWSQVLADVSESRKISVDSLNSYADRFVMLNDPQDYLKIKMVDKLVYADEVKAEINKLLKADADDDINQVLPSTINNIEKDKSGDEIAVYYAYGDIVQTASETSFSVNSGHQIIGEDVTKDLAALAKDDNVKAVVIRINSGGGSAYASEQIWRAIELLKKEKPVVVSMGGMAASGGYYMSCNSNWIVAEPTSITGSIGIFGMFPDFSELVTQKLGIKFEEVKTNKYATFGNMMARSFNAEEMAMLDKYIQRGYELFLKRVGDGRGMTRDQVDQIAQGHVYTAADAKKLKLVDELGGLDEAVKKAAKLAKLDEYYTEAYPAEKQWYETLFEKNNTNSILDAKLHETMGEFYEPFVMLKNIKNQDAIQARIPFIIKH